MSDSAVIEQILELARWAPSGDNSQPWRFAISNASELVVHGFDTREYCVYDFDGRPSQISLGAMLETLRIAASAHRLRADVSRRLDSPDAKPTFDVRLIPDALVEPSPLLSSIVQRTVQRRAMRSLKISAQQKAELEASLGAGYRVVWRESFADRARMALLLFRNAKIRLTMPEAYPVHRDIIEYGAAFSTDRIPDQAIGLDPVTIRTMRWVMASWSRVKFFNTFLGGTILPRIELDLLPGVACAAHFVIVAAQPPMSIDDFVDAGAALQRFWLTATRSQLYVQPEMTPLIFSWYVRAGRRFSTVSTLWDQALDLTQRLSGFLGADDARSAVFLGRIGTGPAPTARSLRLPLDVLTLAVKSRG